MIDKNLRINEQIQVREVRLIDSAGSQRGLVRVPDALAMAREEELDLVEVVPQSRPPVCKILDYGKYKFEQERWKREQQRKKKLVRLKEVRMQLKISQHDLAFKAKHVQEFLSEGNRVKVTVRFRGRELAHTELGRVVLEKFRAALDEDSFTMESPPRMEGRFMSMLLGPSKKKAKG